MRPEHALAMLACCLLLAGCSRLSFVEKSAKRGGYTQVAPTYKVSDHGRKGAPANAAALIGQAASSYTAGDLAKAREFATAALRQDKAAAGAHNILGLVADAAGDAAEAGKHYKAAVDARPGEGAHLNNYGAWLCGNGRAAESLPWFDRALGDAAYPARADALANAGRCAALAGQPQLAETRLRAALQLAPDHVAGLASMAELAYGAGRDLEARAFSERRLAAAPPDRDALQLAARIEDRLGDASAAARYRAMIVRLPPDPARTTP